MQVKRHQLNPIIRKEDMEPTRDDFHIIGVFNPGATVYKDEILLLVRVAEKPNTSENYVQIPILDTSSGVGEYRIKTLSFRKNDPSLDCTDPRVVYYKGKMYLTSISHLRLARSKDGYHFTMDKNFIIYPQGVNETYGIEDSRIVRIDKKYCITYSASSEGGICTCLISTTDWKTYERHGIIFHPMNKDVAIFPEKIKGKYLAFHRPDSFPCSKPSMWLASSPDLIHWGDHQRLMSPREGYWDAERIGAGASPILTEKGWLEIYHGVSPEYGYALGALLLDPEDPRKILGRSSEPIMRPTAEYERNGFFGNTIFTDGYVSSPEGSDHIFLYYGAADTSIGMAEISLTDILDSILDKNLSSPVLETVNEMSDEK